MKNRATIAGGKTARQLGDPRRLVRVYRSSNARDRRYHHTASRITGVPFHAPPQAEVAGRFSRTRLHGN